MKPKFHHQDEPSIFAQSQTGRIGCSLPKWDVPVADATKLIGSKFLRSDALAGLPEVSEPQVMRHFVRLSQLNHSIDTGFYPLGSCTMKYNPKINEEVVGQGGFAKSHPMQPTSCSQGALEIIHQLEKSLCQISGMDAVTLQPAAGAQGEFAALLVMRAYLEDREGKQSKRRKILIPDSAHGTNPASCTLCGFDVVELRSNDRGLVDLEHLESLMTDEVAGLMLTNPNTLGFFEENVHRIADIVHGRGGLLYCDGANLNALLGNIRPGDIGFDLMHINLHKTFTTPHGGGGPGSGPVAVKKHLIPFLPQPRVVRRESRFYLEDVSPKSIGRISPFMGNFGMFVRALCYIQEMGAVGLKAVGDMAVLNANYLREKLKGDFHLPYPTPSMHEVVFSDQTLQALKVSTMDLAKRLLDYGFHPPTVFFPLVVKGALMMEPTETESKETLDQFILTLQTILAEAKEDPEILKQAPHTTKFRRLDETRAARDPKLRF